MATGARHNWVVDLLIGGASAGVTRLFTAPVERTKLLLQVQDDHLKAGQLDRRYSGFFDCLIRTARREGVLSLWNGFHAGILRYFPTQFLNFGLRDGIKKLWPQPNPRTNFGLFFLSSLASGGLAGALSLLVVYPLDFAQTRLACQLQDASGRYKYYGIIDCWRQVITDEGTGSLFRGFGISVAGIVVYRGVYFGLYDSVRALRMSIRDPNIRDSIITKFIVAQVVAIAAGLATYPFDTIRRKMMLHSADEVGYSSTFSTIGTIIKDEGPLGLFAGAGSNIVRTVVSALVLVLYDAAKDVISS